MKSHALVRVLGVVLQLLKVECQVLGLPGCPCRPADFLSSTYWSSLQVLKIPTSKGLLSFNDTETFGSYCATWDARLPGLCNSPDECQQSYCYVDSANCSTANYPSTYFPGMHLQYSYLTCGDQASQDDFLKHIRTQLTGQTFRFAFPAGSRPWHYQQDDTWTGSVATFYKQLQQTAGFQSVQHSVSEASLGLYRSPWDACVHDVRCS